MRVLLLNQTYHPDVAATAQHAHDLALHLVKQGHEVVVVTSRSIYGATGATLPRREIVEGIEVHRVAASMFGKRGILARAADFGIFYLLATWRVLTIPRVDIVVPFTTPPLIAGVGLLRKWLRGTPYVYWVMDLYPDVAVACGVMKRGGLLERVFETVSRRCMAGAAKVVVLGRCMHDLLRRKGVPEEKLEHIGVWADRDEIRSLPREQSPLREQWGLADQFVVEYSGNLGVAHDTDAICGAMLRLAGDQRIRFVFVGGGRKLDVVKRFAAEHQLPNVQFQPYQPREAIPQSLAVGDVHLISQLPELTGMIVPCKLFGVLAAGRPVLYVGPADTEVAQVIADADCGWTVTPGDDAALAEAILALADDPSAARAMASRARKALETRYDRSIACAAWTRVLEAVVGTEAGDHQLGTSHAHT